MQTQDFKGLPGPLQLLEEALISDSRLGKHFFTTLETVLFKTMQRKRAEEIIQVF